MPKKVSLNIINRSGRRGSKPNWTDDKKAEAVIDEMKEEFRARKGDRALRKGQR